MPREERPVSKLMYFGASSLSNAELLSIVTGAKDYETPARMLCEMDGLGYMASCPAEELAAIDGVTPLMAARAAASAELGKRMSTPQEKTAKRDWMPEDLAEMFMAEMKHLKQEHVKVAMFNIRSELISVAEISIGSIANAIIEPRDVFREAIKRGAASIVLIHNHPSGHPEPSGSDMVVHKQIAECGRILGIRLVDFIIIGDGEFRSFRRDNDPSLLAALKTNTKAADAQKSVSGPGHRHGTER
jgi:DNA repair protein RadC